MTEKNIKKAIISTHLEKLDVLEEGYGKKVEQWHEGDYVVAIFAEYNEKTINRDNPFRQPCESSEKVYINTVILKPNGDLKLLGSTAVNGETYFTKRRWYTKKHYKSLHESFLLEVVQEKEAAKTYIRDAISKAEREEREKVVTGGLPDSLRDLNSSM